MASPHLKTSSPHKKESELLLSFARGLSVIEAFSQSSSSQSMADIARLTQLPRATVRRILLTLVDLGYAKEEDKQFSLTPKILTLAHSYLSSSRLPHRVQPILEEISQATGEASSFAVLNHTSVIYIARAAEEKMRIMSNSLHVGSSLPAYCTSMGRAILSQLPLHEQQRILKESVLHAYTPHTLVQIEAILAQLEHDRINQFSLVNQELEVGLCSLAIPIKNHVGQLLGAINISTHTLRKSPDELEHTFLPLLRTFANKIHWT